MVPSDLIIDVLNGLNLVVRCKFFWRYVVKGTVFSSRLFCYLRQNSGAE